MRQRNPDRDPAWRSFTVAVLLIAALAGVGVSYFHGSTAADKAKSAATTAKDAATQAKAAAAEAASAAANANRAVNCLNSVLADRNGPGARDNAAQAAFAKEAKRWVRSLNGLFAVKPGTAAATAAVKAFKDETVTFQIVITSLARTLAADQKIRDANPLGKC